jgi:hypothetical protein
MTDLSPAAQAVLDAFFASDWEDEPLHANIARAFRALAVRINGADAIRQDVLDIADELENTRD